MLKYLGLTVEDCIEANLTEDLLSSVGYGFKVGDPGYLVKFGHSSGVIWMPKSLYDGTCIDLGVGGDNPDTVIMKSALTVVNSPIMDHFTEAQKLETVGKLIKICANIPEVNKDVYLVGHVIDLANDEGDIYGIHTDRGDFITDGLHLISPDVTDPSIHKGTLPIRQIEVLGYVRLSLDKKTFDAMLSDRKELTGKP